MKKRIIFIVCILLIVLFLKYYNFYHNNNLIFISNSKKVELMEILKISESNTFKPISKKYYSGFHGSDPDFYQIKFEISIEEYEINNLVYYDESYYEVLVDCHHKEKINETTYMCVVRASNIHNKELFKLISKF